MEFETEELIDLVYEGETDNLKLIENKISGNSRWSIFHDVIFQDKSDGKFYKTNYSVGATENQDESPFENEEDEMECLEVFPNQVLVTVYKDKP